MVQLLIELPGKGFSRVWVAVLHFPEQVID
jgi:hypothetical protein